MKVKIRGLVFVGFAAAVFAQSAMADANDAKTVTSKLYVDTTFQTLNNITTTSELTVGNGVTEQMVNEHWASNSEYPSMAVLNEVKSQVTGIDVNGDETYINVADNAGTFTVSPKLAPATANSDITGTLTETNGDTIGTKYKLVTANAVKSLIDTGLSDATNGENDTTVPTSLAVVSYAEKKANKATEITDGDGGNSTSDTAYPTTKAVYDFVTTQGGNFQPKVDEAAATTMYVGKYVPADGNTLASATWDKLTTGTYVANTSTTAGTYTLDIPTTKVASVTTDFVDSNDANASTKRPKLTTAGAVYDFVKAEGGNYQPKIDNARAGKIMIGFNTQTGEGSGATYSSDWKELIGASTDASSAVGYVTIKEPVWRTGAYEVNIAENMIAVSGSNIAAADTTGDGTAYMNDLTTALAVKQYVTGLTGGLTIPAPGPDCQLGANGITDSNDKACALVLAYWTAAESPTGTAGVGLKWVPMAQTVSSGSSNQQSGGQ